MGTNDADKDGTTAIVGKFRASVRELKARRVGKIWISGILPVTGGRKGYRNCRRMSINSQLDGMCRQEMVGFVDLWATFAGRPDLYRKDGLHMTDQRYLGQVWLGLWAAVGPFFQLEAGGEIYVHHK